MSRPTDNNTPFSVDAIDEDRVRRALGLKSSGSSPTHQQRPEQARARHRFVADGAVPVVMLNRADGEANGLKERLSAAERALENEKGAHANTRRALQEATQANQGLQTRLSHNELASADMIRSEREARRIAEAALADLRAALHAETARAKSLEAALAAAKAEHEAMQQKLDQLAVAAPVQPEARVRREVRASEPIPRKPRSKSPKEPKPVRWWTPSYRAKQS